MNTSNVKRYQALAHRIFVNYMIPGSHTVFFLKLVHEIVDSVLKTSSFDYIKENQNIVF